MSLHMRKFKTDSNNPYWIIYKNCNITNVVAVLTEFDMAEFKFDVMNESQEIQNLNDINFSQFIVKEQRDGE